MWKQKIAEIQFDGIMLEGHCFKLDVDLNNVFPWKIL